MFSNLQKNGKWSNFPLERTSIIRNTVGSMRRELFCCIDLIFNVLFHTVCVKDCGLHYQNIDMIILFSCLVGWFNSSPEEIKKIKEHY